MSFLKDNLINCFSNGNIIPLLGLISNDFAYILDFFINEAFEFYGFIKLLIKVMLSVEIDIYIFLYYY